MTCNPACAAPDDTLNEVDRKMRQLMVAFLPVCGDHQEFCGIITFNNLLPRFLGREVVAVTAAELAVDPPVTVGMNDPVDRLPRLMAQHGVWLLPVVEEQRLVGVIRYSGLVNAMRSA